MIVGVNIATYIVILLIGVPTFFTLRMIFKGFLQDKRKRQIATWITTLVAVPAMLVGMVVFYWFIYFKTPDIDFDKEEWLTNKHERFQMAEDLIESKRLINKDTGEVRQLLGNPDWGSDSLSFWVYDMGAGGGGLGFLFHTLHIKFDSNKVVNVEHGKRQD